MTRPPASRRGPHAPCSPSRASGVAAVVGASAVVAAWPLLFLAMLGGLAAAMSPRYGGFGWGNRGGLLVSWGIGLMLTAGLVWLVIWLLRQAGLLRPLVVVFGALGLTGALTVACVLVLQVVTAQPPAWTAVLFPLVAALCFGGLAGWMQPSTRMAAGH